MRAEVNRICSAAACVACAGVVFLFAASALAGETRTECPLTHPHMPDVRLRSGECLPGGGPFPWSWRPDQVIDHGNRVRTDVNIYRRDTTYDPLRQAKIKCNYGHYKDKYRSCPGAGRAASLRNQVPAAEILGTGIGWKGKSGRRIRVVRGLGDLGNRRQARAAETGAVTDARRNKESLRNPRPVTPAARFRGRRLAKRRAGVQERIEKYGFRLGALTLSRARLSFDKLRMRRALSRRVRRPE